MAFTIIMQFIMQTCLITALFIMWNPVISQIAYHTGLFDNSDAQVKSIRDALWNWSIVIPIAAMGGNVVWLFRTLQRQEANEVG